MPRRRKYPIETAFTMTEAQYAKLRRMGGEDANVSAALRMVIARGSHLLDTVLKKKIVLEERDFLDDGPTLAVPIRLNADLARALSKYTRRAAGPIGRPGRLRSATVRALIEAVPEWQMISDPSFVGYRAGSENEESARHLDRVGVYRG